MIPTHTEVAIVGGGPAGLSAALVLGRARRHVTLFDAGAPRNAPSPAAHSFFTRDGTPPAELLRIGRDQLRPYASVTVVDRPVAAVRHATDARFELTDADDRRLTAHTLILATGVVDQLPDLPGLRALWGTGVFHCPYCHGWEVRDQPFVLIAQSESDLHFARLLRGWSTRLTVCPSRPDVVPAAQQAELADLGVDVTPDPVARLIPGPDGHVADVVLGGGRRLGPCAVFLRPTLRQRATFAADLGCRFVPDGPFQGLVDVDDKGFTGVPGLYAVGDAARGAAQVLNAAHQGAAAAVAINNDLLLANRLPAAAAQQHAP